MQPHVLTCDEYYMLYIYIYIYICRLALKFCSLIMNNIVIEKRFKGLLPYVSLSLSLSLSYCMCIRVCIYTYVLITLITFDIYIYICSYKLGDTVRILSHKGLDKKYNDRLGKRVIRVIRVIRAIRAIYTYITIDILISLNKLYLPLIMIYQLVLLMSRCGHVSSSS